MKTSISTNSSASIFHIPYHGWYGIWLLERPQQSLLKKYTAVKCVCVCLNCISHSVKNRWLWCQYYGWWCSCSETPTENQCINIRGKGYWISYSEMVADLRYFILLARNVRKMIWSDHLFLIAATCLILCLSLFTLLWWYLAVQVADEGVSPFTYVIVDEET